jgi:hypothetical protein
MRITESTIDLVQPVFGRRCLTGTATSGPPIYAAIDRQGQQYRVSPMAARLKAPFTLRFGRPGVDRYYCLMHGPLMMGTITVVPARGETMGSQ